MKRKIVAILVCMLIAIGSTFTVLASKSIEKQNLVTQSNKSKQVGNTLITEGFGNRVIEVDIGGTIVWQMTMGLNTPVDAERLPNGNTLITDGGNTRVIEVDSGGNIVWAYNTSTFKFDAERLANGNTLISEVLENRVIEVNSSGTIIWNYNVLYGPWDAERLTNGNTLIADTYNTRVIEVNSSGTIVWQKTGLYYPVDAERLANGNTLITELGNNRVIEVDISGNLVWVYSTSSSKYDAERLGNGNTLISEFNYGNDRVIEVDSSGTIVWEKTGLDTPIDVERISIPPGATSIGGKTSGKTGKQYEYTFNATDPDGDNIRYIIDWGDNTSNTTGYNPSSTDVKVKHTFSNDGTYNITAKAQDIHGFEGPEGTLTVTMPKNKPSNFNFNLLDRFFERFPNLFTILRQIFG